MGLALAQEAARRGAEVTLVSANVSQPPPAGVRTVAVATAAELEAALRAEFGASDVLLMAAAPADFRPASPDPGKIAKRDHDGLLLELEPTTDILAALASERRAGQTLVGFAAEHGQGATGRGRDKLARKRLDAVVVNDVSRSDIGFDSDQNEVTIVLADGERRVARAPKAEIAGAILDVVQELRTSAGGRSTVEGRP
jgi:phosphopantothenoylcysteine decarboxylase/phosphopantothenate--cysteine ligase